MKKVVLITFVSSLDDEIIITVPELETQTVKDYFTLGGRNLQDYDRVEYSDDISINPRMRINGQIASSSN